MDLLVRPLVVVCMVVWPARLINIIRFCISVRMCAALALGKCCIAETANVPAFSLPCHPRAPSFAVGLWLSSGLLVSKTSENKKAKGGVAMILAKRRRQATAGASRLGPRNDG